MKVVFYTMVSPHQLPLAREVAKLIGFENFVYVADDLYWRGQTFDAGEIVMKEKCEAEELLERCEVLYTGGYRPIDLMERRAARGLRTFYASERWFKPILVGSGKWVVGSGKWVVGSLPGWLRMLVPSYRRMVKRFVSWANGDPEARVLAIGPWAKRDFLKMGVKGEKIVDWGYFVAPSTASRKAPPQEPPQDSLRELAPRGPLGAASPSLRDLPSEAKLLRRISLGLSDSSSTSQTTRTLRVLWAGRDIPLKHVRHIERAVNLANARLVGCGQWVASRGRPIEFTKLTGVSPAEVRESMREHDVFVFASDAQEGWGAVVSEALEEGMKVICSSDCGSGPSLLPPERLFKSGDVVALAKLLEAEYHGELPPCSIGEWTARKAAERLCAQMVGGR